MWGLESQLSVVRERMKLLLASHGNDLTAREHIAEEGELLMEQGAIAERILLLMEGTVAVQLKQGENQPHTLAIVEAEEILGEMGLFGNGVHSADVRVINGPAKLIAVDGNEMLQAMLFDADLTIEILALICQRCLKSNQIMGLLLDGISAVQAGDREQLTRSCEALRAYSHSMALAAEHLESIGG